MNSFLNLPICLLNLSKCKGMIIGAFYLAMICLLECQPPTHCDLVITWTWFYGTARTIFKKSIELDAETWLRAKAWTLGRQPLNCVRHRIKLTAAQFYNKSKSSG